MQSHDCTLKLMAMHRFFIRSKNTERKKEGENKQQTETRKKRERITKSLPSISFFPA